MKKKSRSGVLFLGFLLAGAAGNAGASSQYSQTWLPGECIPQFAAKMPVFGSGPHADLPRVDAKKYSGLTVKMKETAQQVLPPGGLYANHFSTGNTCPTVNIQPTTIWGYETSDTVTGKILGPALWPAVTIETRRNIPTVVKYVNELPNGPGSLQQLITVDKTIHWADPYSDPAMMNPCMDPEASDGGGKPCKEAYLGPVPAVPHLHGGEIPSEFDGGPEAWFTPDGRKGAAYRTIDNPGDGQAIYLYNNSQEPGTPWFHDHTLGATRTNVYSGLAAFYLIRDPSSEPKKLPEGPYEFEMAIQDRQFDTNSQLFFPDGSGHLASNLIGPPPNPDIHPFWIPEFIGDVVVVNGTPWPYREVEPRRYRFRIVDGSNARFYNLTFGDKKKDNLLSNVPVYAIGADVSYLDKPAGPLKSVLLAPGERADLIVDFSQFAGKTITVTNDARVPFPDGPAVPLPAGDPGVMEGDIPQPQMANIMQFKVKQPLQSKDKSCNPAAGECTRRDPMVRLTDGEGQIAKEVKINKVRQLILKEQIGFDTSTTPPTETGPLEVLVNNTEWDGLRSPGIAATFPEDGISELPQVGSVELWEIINLTMDAHPMHTHLTQFQILNIEGFNADEDEGYPAAWAKAFGSPLPEACYGDDPLNPCPGYGPPLPYFTGKTKNLPNGQKNVPIVGGNPLVDPFLSGNPAPPAPEEAGWKETVKVLPGQVTRILVRWAPTSTPVKAVKPGQNLYPFDPTTGPGYVWHCHIIDHEDNEMMRPYKVIK